MSAHRPRNEVDLETGIYGKEIENDDIHPHTQERKNQNESQNPADFYQMLAIAAMEQKKDGPLYTENKDEKQIRVRALQYMNICHLKRELATEVKQIRDKHTTSHAQMERIRKSMKHYVGALRDLRFMLESRSANPRTEEFLRNLLYIKDAKDHAILLDAGFIHPDPGQGNEQYYPRVYNYTGEGGGRHREDTALQQTREFLNRVKMALFGGIALVAPMLIMRLHPTELTTLLTTSIFVLVVAVILAWYMKEADKKDILGATAAYAAVLVVFVGASSGG